MRHEGSLKGEVVGRTNALRKAYFSFNKVWFKPIPDKLRALAYNATVEANIFSGLDARVHNSQQRKQIDKVRIGFLRKLVREGAVNKL